MATKKSSKAVNPTGSEKGTHARGRPTLRTYPRAAALAVGAAFAPVWLSSAFADPASTQLPTGGTVAAGTVTISTTGTKMQIDQASDKAIINWQNFSIGSSGWVNFNQPSASSVALNRSTQAVEIFGRLSANGQVFITSNAGVYFARSASVDVGSLFASSLSISDQNFLAGKYNFTNDGGAGKVTNDGTIVAVGGYAALAAPQVRNNGIIVASAGTVALAAGDRVSLDMIGDGLVKVSVDGAALNALALNAGTILADGGRVLLTARSANALLDTVINNTGVIRATTLSMRKGEIVLEGGDHGLVANSGTLDASGTGAGLAGGTVKVLGQYVALDNGTRIDVSGDAGGGLALIGGNFHGAGPEQNASTTSVAADARINADANTSGNGGQVAVWSNDHTAYNGAISARGGTQSGDGGFIEISGQHGLDLGDFRADQVAANPRAAGGKAGTVLFDPNQFTIDDAFATSANGLLAGGTNVDVQTTDSTAANDNIIFTNGTTALNTAGATAGAKLNLDADDFITGATGSNLLGTNYSALLKISLTGTASKTYDGNATAILAPGNFIVKGTFDTDTVGVTQTGGTYTNGKNVVANPAGSPVTASVTSGDLSGAGHIYSVQGNSAAGNIGEITPLALTGTAIAAGTSVYASALAPGAVTFSNVVGADDVTSTATVNTTTLSTSNNPIVGTYTQTAGALGGADAANYSGGAGFTSAANYSITKLALAGTAIAGASTTYASALTPGAVTFGNVVGADDVTSTATVNTSTLSTSGNPIVGTYNQTAGALSGVDAGNYSGGAGFTSAANYAITQLGLTVASIAGGTSVYNSALTPGAVTLNAGVVSGDLVTSTAAVDTTTLSTGGHPIVGTYTQTAGALSLSGADAANYSLTPFTTGASNYSITQLALAGTAIAAGTNVYASALTPGAVSFGNVASGDVVTSTATVNTTTLSTSNNPIVGTYTQTAGALGGADAANYSGGAGFTSAANYSITKLALAGTAIAGASTTYASALTPGAVTFGNVVGADDVTSTATVNTSTLSTSGNPIVGTYNQTAGALSGVDAGNYSGGAGFTSAANYAITQLGLTVASIAGGTSVYNSVLTPGAVTLNAGVVSGDLVTSTAAVDTTTLSTGGHPIVGTYTQTAGALSLSGADAANYSLTPFTTGASNYSITQLALAGTAIAAGTNVYASALTPGAVSFGNVASGDVVTSTATVNTTTLSTSNNPIVGTYTQTAGALGGADAANYSGGAGFTSAANYSITKLALAGTAIAGASTTYASALTPGAVTFGNVVGADDVTSTATVNTSTLSTSGNPIVGTYNQTAGALSGVDAGNYSGGAGFTSAANYAITQLGLTVASIAGGTSVYNSVLTPGAVTLNAGVVSGDLVTSTAAVDTTTLSTGGHPIVGTYTQTAGALSLSGADAANYSLTPFTTGASNYSITQLALAGTAIAAGTNVYASALTPGAVSFGNVASGDVVTSTATVNTTTLSTSNNPIVGTYTQTAGALGGADAANYSGGAGFTSAANYSITKLALTGTAIAGGTSVYASAVTPGAVTFGNVVGADVVTSTATVNTSTLSTSGNPIVGSYAQTAGALGGADAGNYSGGAGFTSAANYSITKLALTGAAVAGGTSVYNSALTPGAVTFGNVVGADVVNSAATVDTTTLSTGGHPIVGSYTQTASTSLTGADGGNYSFVGFTSASNYSITQLALAGTAIAAGTNVYASALTPGAVSFGNVASGDVVTSTASVNTTTLSTSGNPIVGSYTQTSGALAGADNANYSGGAGFTSAANYSITKLALTGTAIAGGTSVYASAVTPGAVTFGNVVGADVVTSTATVNTSTLSTSGNPIVGSYAQTAGALGGADAGNYSGGAGFTSAANYSITKLALTGAAVAGGTSVYNSALTPGAVTFGNVVGADVVNSAATVDTTTLSTGGHPIVGSYTQTASTSLTGADGGNYSFVGFTSASNYSITQLALAGTAIAAGTNVYASALTPGAVSFGNVASGDVVTSTASVNTTTLSTSGNPIVGSYTQTSGALAGADNANYSGGAGFTSAANYSITKLALTGTAIAGGTSVYASAVTPGAVTFGNIVGADVVTTTASVNTSTLSTGGHPIVGSYAQSTGALAGADSGNYSLTPFTSAANYSISQASISSVTITSPGKTYDGNVTAPLNTGAGQPVFNGLASGDSLTVTAATGSFADKNVGTGKAVSITGITIGGADVGNYTLSSNTNSTTANITQLSSVTWTGAGGNLLWSNSNNWAGNAIPDLGNVASVNLNGAAVTMDLGSVQSTGVSNGVLNLTTGSFTGPSFTANLSSYNQTGGSIATTGSIIITTSGTLKPRSMSSSAGSVTLTGSSILASGCGTPSSCSIFGGSGTFSSGVDVTDIYVDMQGKALLLTGNATSWNLNGASTAPSFAVTSSTTNIFYNGSPISGAALVAIQQSGSVIGSTLAETARAALLDQQDTDSVQKQISYGFVGDVGTTPPMDHRIDETGISVPACFGDSREGQTCR